ncbi:LysR family transcriptional regulator [Jiella avicenniae]|uniref:HTH lysR-type domain-containing protein n=1 Tax=Jiella avicenniae TaxID=2907202 RepID=A0A9X1NZI9_9HYPH|nr:LysR family transcriptional regulator [Jiella avicenniae]MCE7027575.1 hypothetical protein [Jiella avicenniae]
MKHIALDSRQLDAFAAVISIGSVTGAVRTPGRSQPVVPRQSRDLEATLGYSPFDRNGPRIAPSGRCSLIGRRSAIWPALMATMDERIDAVRAGSPRAIDRRGARSA